MEGSTLSPEQEGGRDMPQAEVLFDLADLGLEEPLEPLEQLRERAAEGGRNSPSAQLRAVDAIAQDRDSEAGSSVVEPSTARREETAEKLYDPESTTEVILALERLREATTQRKFEEGRAADDEEAAEQKTVNERGMRLVRSVWTPPETAAERAIREARERIRAREEAEVHELRPPDLFEEEHPKSA